MIHVLADAETLARAVAARMEAAGNAAIDERGIFRLALPGGNTPRRLYELLASPESHGRLDWTRVEVLFADERAVPPEDPRSNYRLVRETLLDAIGIAPASVHRMRGEADDLEEAAREYERLLATPLDLLLLGLGADGHVASLFPGSPVADSPDRRVRVVADSPKPPARRLTLGPRAIREAREVVVLASGEEKAAAVAAALEGVPDPMRIPATLLRQRDWYVDRAAAAGLRRG